MMHCFPAGLITLFVNVCIAIEQVVAYIAADFPGLAPVMKSSASA
jgi:hypothetical protein